MKEFYWEICFTVSYQQSQEWKMMLQLLRMHLVADQPVKQSQSTENEWWIWWIWPLVFDHLSTSATISLTFVYFCIACIGPPAHWCFFLYREYKILMNLPIVPSACTYSFSFFFLKSSFLLGDLLGKLCCL